MDKLKRFFTNGILMTLVALATRYVSVGFNVYISNKIGSVSMGLFTLVTSVYGFALTVATSGINLATTKLVSEALGLGQIKDGFNAHSTALSVMKKSLLFALSVSSLAAVVLFLCANFIGCSVLGDPRTVSSLQILAFSLPPIALSSSLSGYFIALRKVYKNALIQIFGQATRIFLCVILLSAAVAKDTESACIAIVTATTVSELLCFAFHSLLFVIERKRNKALSNGNAPDKSLPSKLIGITVPVAFSAYMRSALITVEHLLIPRGLEKSGVGRDASLSSYGTLHSVIFPLILLPSAISSSFAGLLIPEISESDAADDRARIERIVSRVMKTVLIYSIGTAGIMMCLSSELASVLLPKTDSATLIIMIAPLIPIMYLDTSVDSILKGLGYQFYTMVINIIDASLSVILVWILLPRFGIMGYVITVYFTEIINATLSITKLICVTKPHVRIFDWIVKPIAAVIVSTFLVSSILGKLQSFAQNRFDIFIHVVLIASVYFVLLILLRAISPRKIKKSVLGFIKA
ncbi:MAG: polysaccharide biosynthesis protein [Clostridia bacterium]|nr:polysaccharide biosynthesis protein [Clostridia bacterium]